MASLSILRDSLFCVRRDRQDWGASLVAILIILLIAGCWTDIAYEPEGESTGSPPAIEDVEQVVEPAASDEPELPLETDQAASNTTLPTDNQAEAPSDQLFPDDLFADIEATGPDEDDQSTPRPPTEVAEVDLFGPLATDESEQSPPLDVSPVEAPIEEQATEPTKLEEPTTAAVDTSSLLPWEIGPVPPLQETETANEPLATEEGWKPAVPPVAESSPSDSPSTETPNAAPTVTQPLDSRALTWKFANRLSYLLVAPDSDMDQAAGELRPVAELLEIDLPELASMEQGSAEQFKQLLATGREVGTSIADKYGMDHAALVEVAFKSNLLLALAESRPQLKHSVNGSVSAAAVRAGLPESVWQPWQTQVAQSRTADEIATAVIELQTQVEAHLNQTVESNPTDELPPTLR